jgi:hypothetical protein
LVIGVIAALGKGLESESYQNGRERTSGKIARFRDDGNVCQTEGFAARGDLKKQELGRLTFALAPHSIFPRIAL